MACDSGGEVRSQEPLPAVDEMLEQQRRPLLVDAPVRNMNTIGMLLTGFADVNQVNAIGSAGLYWYLLSSLPLLWQPKSELSDSDYQYPVFPLNANITGDSHDIECRQLDPCNESNNVESQKGNDCRLSNVDSYEDGDSAKNDNPVIPILVLTVSLDQPLQHLMNLYAQKTKTKLEYQYFVHGRKTLQPDHTFLFYGVERDTTIHVCTRLLGGIVTIEEYLIHNKERFLIEDKSTEPWTEKFKNDDGIELMIPASNEDLILNILHNWIKSKTVDINPEFALAPDDGDDDAPRVEENLQRRGRGNSLPKQPQVQRSLLDAAKSASPRPQSSSRFSSPASSQDTKGKGKQRK
ncbi:uncharacterized protein C2845_PM17G14970 [Panicum miliaceum]|uniref:Ubiquitin-like domain-containing protein n=1 Tax=Panicum miliaceum TaxID=4540 RepID=A0A3L6Q504_PANMI|nr:uncharacterized protein C2845_PM17G14970 [Panicum miliaceum]